MNLDTARALADAVMLEGYALYPFRASAPKNRYRWTFGVLAPRVWAEAGGCEPWWLELQVLVAHAPVIAGQLRFFQIERRRGGELGAPWDEGIVQTIDFIVTDGDVPFASPPEYTVSAHVSGGTIVRERLALDGRIVMRREPLSADHPLERVTIRIENTTPWWNADAARDEVIAAAFASTHVILGATGGELLSSIDPPAWARTPAARCTSTRTYPVLVGEPGTHDVMLAAPFALYDHPQLAPESAGDYCDATEIDELLALRTRTLTDDEKREARATDPRTAEIVDRSDALPPAWFDRVHGVVRDLVAGEMLPRLPQLGTKVRLRPTAARRTDAQDVLYAGHTATVAAIRHDVDGSVFLAVTIDDDPAAELHDWYGRYHYYRTDEVELL